MPVETITHAEFLSRLKAQGVSREHLATICPVCGQVQSMAMLAAAGCPADKVDTQFGFSCVGRWNDAGPWKAGKQPDGKPGCDWTLGGLFTLHELEVEFGGKAHPSFVVATPEQAQALVKAGPTAVMRVGVAHD